ncbi:MAG: sigma-70 family RNA polymerase sigma factor [Prevotella sp.]|nr:sigma-70 family RNA polymerase sigma factor [Prevotella sp.]MBR3414311.1 sigma-70 family RNA polymerase sigma factor [Bacteroidales bacterium]
MNQEEQIILRCQQGDRQAMGQLYTAMHDELLGVCRRYVNDGNTAEDLLHDAFLLIFSKIGELRSPRKARGWMRKVVKNVSLLYAENQDKLPTVSLDQVSEKVDEVAQTPLRAEVGESLPLTYDELMNIIDTLPEGYRRVFRLSVLEGLSHQEIAALLNIEPHSSSSQLYRAKTILRQSLAVLLFSLLFVVVMLFRRTTPPNDSVVGNASQRYNPSTVVGNASQRYNSSTVVGDASKRCNPSIENSSNISQAVPESKHDSLQKHAETATHGSVAHYGTDEIATLGSVAHYDADETATLGSVAHYHLDLAYSGLPNPDRSTLPYGADGMNGEIDSTAHHRMPMTISLNLSYQLTKQLSLTAGLQHTWLSSEFKTGNTFSFTNREQKLRYLGLRLGADYRLLTGRHWHLYGSASAVCNLPLHGSSRTLYIYNGQQIGQEDTRLHPKAQWSVGAGMGLQYDLTPTVGFFLEPSLQYHFRNGDGIETWYSDHRLSPTLPLGVRITIK